MITTTTMYWLTRLDALDTVCVIATAFGVVLGSVSWTVFLATASFGDYTNINNAVRKAAKICTSLAIAGILGLTFLPTTKEMAAILVVPRIANSEKVQEIGGRLYDLAVEWMENIRPAKKEGGAK